MDQNEGWLVRIAVITVWNQPDVGSWCRPVPNQTTAVHSLYGSHVNLSNEGEKGWKSSPETPACLSQTISPTAKPNASWARGETDERIHLNFIVEVSTMWWKEGCKKVGHLTLSQELGRKVNIGLNGKIFCKGWLPGHEAWTTYISVISQSPECDLQKFSYILIKKLRMWSENCWRSQSLF